MGGGRAIEQRADVESILTIEKSPRGETPPQRPTDQRHNRLRSRIDADGPLLPANANQSFPVIGHSTLSGPLKRELTTSFALVANRLRPLRSCVFDNAKPPTHER